MQAFACAVLSGAYGGDAMKKSSVFGWYKRYKEGRKNEERDEKTSQDLKESMKILQKCGIWFMR
jgi:hypothetical protein